MSAMSDFVLVHGSWGGGWQWRKVAHFLRAAGHDVSTPTLTGLGERMHCPAQEVSFDTHVNDVTEHLWFEDRTEVVLVGWGYGAMVVESVADLVPERLRLVVNFDGKLALEGQAQMRTAELPVDVLEASLAAGVLEPPSERSLASTIKSPEVRRCVAARLQPQPISPLLHPFPDRGGRRREVPHAYLACVDQPLGVEDARTLAALRADSRWKVEEIPTNHLGPLYAPAVVAAALDDLGDMDRTDAGFGPALRLLTRPG